HNRKKENNGIYNLGSGKAETFLSLAENAFHSMGIEPDISFIDTPEDIRDKYQYFTEAKMEKLRKIGYEKPFHSLKEGIDDYMKGYLKEHKYL
ncbi:MAG: ADP-L-glycero-D-mannoheptose-6-epimerase, partial [Sphingobacteriales bacterium]